MSLTIELDDNFSGAPMPYPKMVEEQTAIAGILQKDIESLINKLQKLKTDPVGFGEKYRVAHGGDLQADEWIENIFPNMPVLVKVKVKIVRKGMLT